jgi:hypothetical protein
LDKLPSTKNTIISLFLSVVLVTGTITALSFSSSLFMLNAQAQSSYTNNNNYKSKDNTNVNINKIKCINDNININGVNSGDVNIGNKNGQGATANSFGNSGEGYYNDDKKTFDCSVSNKNNNTNIISTGGSANNDNQTVPLEPEPEPEPEPTTATLTVKKQIFGCDLIVGPGSMFCSFPINSNEWLDCNNISSFSNPIFCQSLPESIFDIEILDDQNNQIQQFQGSENGTIIENLEPGNYTVNEIKQLSGGDQLVENPGLEALCINPIGFPDGGSLLNSTADILYDICFKYEDEQGNDCSTIVLAAEEEKTCIVKNYIRSADVQSG